MRLLHLSDLHLGFRQFQRTTPAGMNQREFDVASALTRAVDRCIALAPDFIVIGGDVFHVVRPSNPAILHAFREFSRLRAALPGCVIAMVAGNHDAPRSTDTACLLDLFAPMGIDVATTEQRVLRYPDRGVTITAVPDLPLHRMTLEPDPQARYNVLLMHGEVEGTLPAGADPERAAVIVPKAAVLRPEWDYVALGHYHVWQRVGPNAFYSGALEYASSNPWGEIAEERRHKLPGKGLIERDLASGKQQFHKLEVAREFRDLAPIDGAGLSASELDTIIAARIENVSGGIAGKVVRLVLRDVPRHIVRELDHKTIREWQRTALHFHLDARTPDVIRPTADAAARTEHYRPTLADTMRDHLRARPLTSD
ncbi:MAG: metallophosphoesterase, partial [Gemmatimonadaceae bacterium]|nr:metallophosphoesterase [Gemmatimonadaceae bacterium]